MPAAAVIPAELGMGNFVAVKTFVVTFNFTVGIIILIIQKLYNILSAIKLERLICKVNTKAW